MLSLFIPPYQLYEMSYLILEILTLGLVRVSRSRERGPLPSGGYHPGHSFHNDTYVALNKLGYGASSTVWLAQNTGNTLH